MEPDAVARFRAGDEAAVREMVERHGGAVATVARSIVGGSHDDVAEVVQQTFVKAWRAAASLEAGRAIQPWLYSIARRTAIDLLRRERRPTTGDHAPERNAAVESMTFERTVEIYEVRQALDGLPSEEREVMKLSHLLGMTHTEIAEQLGVPVGTVTSRTGRAKRRLAVALSHYARDVQAPDVGANRSGRRDVQEGEEPTSPTNRTPNSRTTWLRCLVTVRSGPTSIPMSPIVRSLR